MREKVLNGIRPDKDDSVVSQDNSRSSHEVGVGQAANIGEGLHDWDSDTGGLDQDLTLVWRHLAEQRSCDLGRHGEGDGSINAVNSIDCCLAKIGWVKSMLIVCQSDDNTDC